MKPLELLSYPSLRLWSGEAAEAVPVEPEVTEEPSSPPEEDWRGVQRSGLPAVYEQPCDRAEEPWDDRVLTTGVWGYGPFLFLGSLCVRYIEISFFFWISQLLFLNDKT